MSSFFTPEKIYDRLLPPELMDDESGKGIDRRTLAAQFRKIPARIDELELIILKATPPRSEKRVADLASFTQSLLSLAGIFMNKKDGQFAAAALTITACALQRKRTDHARAERICASYDEQYTEKLIGTHGEPGLYAQLAELKQDPEKNKKEIEKLTARADKIATDIFAAAALVAPSSGASVLHGRAEKCLAEAVRHDPQNYARLLIKIAPLCFNPSVTPGAASIVQNTYDTFVLQKRAAHDKFREYGKVEAAARTAWELMFVDAGMMVQFHMVPPLNERARKGFAEHWALHSEIAPMAARVALDGFFRAYASHSCKEWFFDQGRKNLLASIEEIKTNKPSVRPSAASQPASISSQPQPGRGISCALC